VLMVGLVAAVITCLFVALFSKWGYCLVAVIIYLIISLVVNKVTRDYSNKYLKQAHFMLALICRCENNRIFL